MSIMCLYTSFKVQTFTSQIDIMGTKTFVFIPYCYVYDGMFQLHLYKVFPLVCHSTTKSSYLVFRFDNGLKGWIDRIIHYATTISQLFSRLILSDADMICRSTLFTLWLKIWFEDHTLIWVIPIINNLKKNTRYVVEFLNRKFLYYIYNYLIKNLVI